MIYLDNAATTKMYKEAIEAEIDVAENFYANSSSIHSFGMESENLIKETKKIFAKVINAKENEIYFTKGASESNNIVISSFASLENTAITTSIEHSSVFDAFNNYKYKKVIYLKNDKYGFIDLEDLKNKLNDNIKLVSIIYVNNEIGTIQDIEKISKIIKDYDENICLHIDATQAIGKIDCNAAKLSCDIMSFSAHKFHGPKGVGGLYISNKFIAKIKPIIYGGRQQVISSGTDNHQAIYAAGVALKKQTDDKEYAYIQKLNSYLREKINSHISDSYIISPENDSSPYILDVAFKNIKAEVLVHYLEDSEIYVSSGSACSKGEDNRILRAIDLDKAYIDGAIRFSFSSYISFEDLDKTADVLKSGIEMIREFMWWSTY